MTKEKDQTRSRNDPLSQALARILRVESDQAEQEIARKIIREGEEERAHKKRVKEALEDGARPRAGRFRL